jgi:hypothetical protein
MVADGSMTIIEPPGTIAYFRTQTLPCGIIADYGSRLGALLVVEKIL